MKSFRRTKTAKPKDTKIYYECIETNSLITFDGKTIKEEKLDNRDIKNYNYYHMFKGYERKHEDLIRFYNDFKQNIKEINDENKKIVYDKYYNHNKAVQYIFELFETVSMKIYIEDKQKVSWLESLFLERVKSCGLMTYSEEFMNKPIINFGYDFSSYYPHLLGSSYYNFEFPYKQGKLSKIMDTKKKLKYGVYDVKITTNDKNLLKIFMLNNENTYTHYEIQFLLRYKKVFKFEMEFLDKEYNALVYDDTDIIESKKICSNWFINLYNIKSKHPKNKVIKHLLASLHGSLSMYKRITVKGDEVKQYKGQISYFNDEAETQYKILDRFYINNEFQYHIVNKDEIYNNELARIKPFLTAFGRIQIAKWVIENNLLDNVIRIHTDGIVFNKEIDLNELKGEYKPKIEQKYFNLKMIWYNCIYNEFNKNQDIDENEGF
jgi:hypothetical protein